MIRRLEHRLPALQSGSGVFERILKLLASDHDNEYMMLDATIVRADQHSAGAQKNGEQTIGRSRGHRGPCPVGGLTSRLGCLPVGEDERATVLRSTRCVPVRE
jgi:hypothetical protein